MKMLMLAALAALTMTCAAAPRRAAARPPLDENGWRCEGDCDPGVKCAYCNPPPKVRKAKRKAKSAASAKRVKSPAKSSPRRVEAVR